MAIKKVFVTGVYRSGTTLIDKLLSNHTNVKIASQPFPFLLFKAKSDFYKLLGIRRKYPLDDLFLEECYNNSDFFGFLKDFKLNSLQIKELLEGMRSYFGCLTPGLIEKWLNPSGGSLISVYDEMMEKLVNLFDVPEKIIIGTKEIFGEEYIPYFLINGYHVILMIRDPRNLITSLNFGKGGEFAGKKRPVLYSIRAWRKSVAFGLMYINHPNFTIIRFEDLINDTGQILNNFSRKWQISKYGQMSTIKDQFGKPWKGNSSFSTFEGIKPDKDAKYKSFLDDQTIDFIESTCYPELSIMGYDVRVQKEELKSNIAKYKEPYIAEHDGFPVDYSHSEQAKKMEITRLDYIFNVSLKDSYSKWFIFKKAYDILITGKSLF
jgi:hypothetical protein